MTLETRSSVAQRGNNNRHKLTLSALLLACLYLASHVLFASGFFLTRVELENISTCNVKPTTMPNQDIPIQSDKNNHACWVKPRFKRVIMIVIDALRIDFAEFQPPSSHTPSSKSAPFHNKLLVLRDLLRSRPENAALFPFLADPPTTTMQRLKGVTTGGLPTFVEFKDDISAEAITEDNLLLQMQRAHRNLTFMGDDTWINLFPTAFNRQFPFPSFNVKDLHTVDNGVLHNLVPELKRPDWDLLIAHFLGVDHVGHRYGPDHFEMAAKLKQMDDAIDTVVGLMNSNEMNDTLLLVMGDHGMTPDGNHGGASEDEVSAALFVYSPQPAFLGHGRRTIMSSAEKGNVSALTKLARMKSSDQHILHRRTENDIPRNDLPEFKSMDEVESFLLKRRAPVNQVDLAPTLALLMGLPIPFGNLGEIIPELFFVDHEHDDHKEIDEDSFLQKRTRSYIHRFRSLNQAMRVNVAQTLRYLNAYNKHIGGGQSGGLDSALLISLATQTSRAFGALDKLEESNEPTDEDLLRAHTHAYHQGQYVLSRLGSEGRALWTQFNMPMMGAGLGIMGLTLVLHVGLIVKLGRTCSIKAVAPAGVLFVLQLLGLFSNSYIVSEGQVHLFLACAGIWLLARCVGSAMLMQHDKIGESQKGSNVSYIGRGKESVWPFPVAVVLVLGAMSRLAIDQGDIQWQQGMEATKSDQSRFSTWFTLAPAIILPALALFAWAALSRLFKSNSSGPSTSSISHIIALSIGFIQSGCVCTFWTLQSQVTRSEDLGSLRLLLPQTVYALAAIATLVSIFALITTRTTNGKYAQPGCNVNAGAVFAQSVIPLVLPWFAPLMLVTGPASPVVFLLLAIHPLALAFVIHRIAISSILTRDFQRNCSNDNDSDNNDNKIDNHNNNMSSNDNTYDSSVSNMKEESRRVLLDQALMLAVFCWPVLASVYFHGSGHENTFNKLQYTAPYVGFDHFNWSRCGVMLALNTFGPHVYLTLTFPIVPATLGSFISSAAAPSDQSKQQKQYKEDEEKQIDEMWSTVSLGVLAHFLNYGARSFATTAFVMAQRRHLMVWAIFAPKYVFDTATLVVVGVATVAAATLFSCVHSKRYVVQQHEKSS